MKTAKAHNEQLSGYIDVTSTQNAQEAGLMLKVHSNKNLRAIEWFPYPKNKPNVEWVQTMFLVTRGTGPYTYCAVWDKDRGEWGLQNGEEWERCSYWEEFTDVIAFAELPTPYTK